MMKKAYVVRSKQVHGGEHPDKINITRDKSLDITEFVFEIQNILRESIKIFIDLLTQYSHHELLTTILDNNILSGGTLYQS